MATVPTLRARATWCAHLFKAVVKQHHMDARPLLSQYIPLDAVVFDVGAHAGQFTKLFAAMAPQGHVYAFEPGAYARSILDKVHRLKRLKNVTVIPQGLSDEEKTATLRIPFKKSGSLGFGLGSLGAEADGRKHHEDTVSLTTIDAFCDRAHLERLDFIKADIEGWEMNMLSGGRKTIERFKPAVMLELNEGALKRACTSPAELRAFLVTLGYQEVEMPVGKDSLFIPKAVA